MASASSGAPPLAPERCGGGDALAGKPLPRDTGIGERASKRRQRLRSVAGTRPG
jgi:hypothetical protein